MPKVKVTPKECKALDNYLSKNFSLEQLINLYLKNSYLWSCDWKPLKEMGFERFVKCLVNGYEPTYPKTPRLRTEKMDISFNSDITTLSKDREIYIGVYMDDNKLSYNAFSIKEAEEISHTINCLLEYYNKYVNQSDSNE